MNYDDDEELLAELREEKASFRSVLNKKKVTKYELDDALSGQI